MGIQILRGSGQKCKLSTTSPKTSPKIDFKKPSGDLEEFEGSWVPESVQVGKPRTLVVYSVFLDAAFLFPQWAMQLLLRQDLPGVLLAFRNRVSTKPKESPLSLHAVFAEPPTNQKRLFIHFSL
jgi:hypothetical protein